MSLLLHDKELMELMENFHILTGMRIVLLDEKRTELISYPLGNETFCACMRSNTEFNRKCRESDALAAERCRKNKELYISRCHAGLIEATAPISENGNIIGYMMFGQITDQKNKKQFEEQMDAICSLYSTQEEYKSLIKKIKYRSKKQIHAASKILEACTSYIQLKEMVHLSEKRLIDKIEEFVDKHIGEEISVERLCKEFKLSRTKLYDIMREYVDGGVASFIRRKKLQYAKHLISTSNMAIAEIASACGFSEYNYFLRVFKSEFGVSPKKLSKTIAKN
ncbi:MAG: PocR ligand-binding domain-containing protein [Clostridia bacterium]|nr:PocR ligand-binding domain-containing protein [Clostridia bacterium]